MYLKRRRNLHFHQPILVAAEEKQFKVFETIKRQHLYKDCLFKVITVLYR